MRPQVKILPLIFSTLTIALFGSMNFTAATEPKPQIKITGTFSDMGFVEESGDVVGTEITILFGGNTYWVLYHEAEGQPAEPKLVKAKVNGTSIEFTVQGLSGKPRIFKGKITKSNLTGSLLGLNESMKLPRKKSYWQ